ncbi:hypothetical protein M8J76_005151 [Diaphorina citri]|nr:hypothetical protein M8J76_005151 [Diaphorina citri]
MNPCGRIEVTDSSHILKCRNTLVKVLVKDDPRINSMSLHQKSEEHPAMQESALILLDGKQVLFLYEPKLLTL